jgi:hypothetical protein
MNLLDDPDVRGDRRVAACLLKTSRSAPLCARRCGRTANEPFQIAVKADDGAITLAGLIDPGQVPGDGIDVASKVPGVKQVLNRVRTAAPGAKHIVEG